MIRVDTALTNYMSIPQHDLISTLRNDLPLGYFGSDLDAVKAQCCSVEALAQCMGSISCLHYVNHSGLNHPHGYEGKSMFEARRLLRKNSRGPTHARRAEEALRPPGSFASHHG